MSDIFPQDGDKLFGLAGGLQTDIRWFRTPHVEETYIKAFKKAADTVVEKLADEAGPFEVDHAFIAALYLYRHCTELQLKYLMYLANETRVATIPDRNFHTHDLLKLWAHARKAIVEMNKDSDQSPLDNAESLVKQLQEADPAGDSFRFTRRKSGQFSLANIPKSFSIEQFQNTMEKLYTFLDCCASQYEEWWQEVQKLDRE